MHYTVEPDLDELVYRSSEVCTYLFDVRGDKYEGEFTLEGKPHGTTTIHPRTGGSTFTAVYNNGSLVPTHPASKCDANE
tara:strand:+ start:68 stop:304 length:237 start_codon:yes stop_codon:yes gene_type:complete